MNIEYKDGECKFRVNGNFVSCRADELRSNIQKYGIRDFSIIISSTNVSEIKKVQEIANNIRLENKVN